MHFLFNGSFGKFSLRTQGSSKNLTSIARFLQNFKSHITKHSYNVAATFSFELLHAFQFHRLFFSGSWWIQEVACSRHVYPMSFRFRHCYIVIMFIKRAFESGMVILWLCLSRELFISARLCCWSCKRASESGMAILGLCLSREFPSPAWLCCWLCFFSESFRVRHGYVVDYVYPEILRV